MVPFFSSEWIWHYIFTQDLADPVLQLRIVMGFKWLQEQIHELLLGEDRRGKIIRDDAVRLCSLQRRTEVVFLVLGYGGVPGDRSRSSMISPLYLCTSITVVSKPRTSPLARCRSTSDFLSLISLS